MTERFQSGLAIAYAPTLNPEIFSHSKALILSLPLQYVFLQRMKNSSGFALVSTPAFGWDNFKNQPSNQQWNFDNHVVLDHDFDGRFFAGINLGYTASYSYSRGAQTPSCTLYVQGGGTIKFTSDFYWGLQFQMSQQFNNFISQPSGWAAFLGTSISMPFSQYVTFSAAYMRQLIGRENDNSLARLNTQSFSQNMGRAAISFNFLSN